MTSAVLQDMRDELDRLLVASANPEDRTNMLGDAVVMAARCDLAGEEYDLRRLSGTLALAMQHADGLGFSDTRDAYAGHLIAVLAEIADLGDEDAATGLNISIEKLPVELAEAGKAAAAMRRKARNGQ